MNSELRMLLEWGGAILAQILVAFIAARAGFVRARAQNRNDDAAAAQIYQRLAAEQAQNNEKMQKDYEAKLGKMKTDYETKLTDAKRISDATDADLHDEIALLRAMIGGPYQFTFLFVTDPKPEILEAHIMLIPKLSDKDKLEKRNPDEPKGNE